MILQGTRAFVAGATGQVGMGAAYALSAAGAEVYLSGRNASKLETVQNDLPNKSHIIALDYSSVDGAKQLKDAVQGLSFDVVVASSGPWWPVTKLNSADPVIIQQATAANFQAHVNLFSVLSSKTKRYVLVNGAASLAIAQTGFTGVLANAVTGLTKMIDNECKNDSAMPRFTHALVQASVGHEHIRNETTDTKEFGKVFVAMALDKQKVDGQGTIVIDDAMATKLTASIGN